MNGAELFVRCLENEDVEYIYGIPGEENIAVMDVLLDSPIKFITTRHEQGAAFMACAGPPYRQGRRLPGHTGWGQPI